MSYDEAHKQMSKEFLLAEFAVLQARFSDYESLKASRVNFLLIIVAAVVATVPAVADRLGPYVGEAMLVTGVVILLLGISTLFRVVEYSISSTIVLRRAGRIRRWFVDQDLSIAPYVAFAPRDDRPRISLGTRRLGWRGGEGVLLTVNSLAASAIAASALYVGAVNGPVLQPGVLVLIGVGAIGFAAAWLAQIGWLQRKLRRTEARAEREVHVPLTSEIQRLYDNDCSAFAAGDDNA